MSLLIIINFSIELAGVCNLINTWCGRGGRQVGSCVGEVDVVCHEVGLATGVTGTARLGDVGRAPPRREHALTVAVGVVRERLVECGPVLHAVTKLAKTHLREVHVVFPVVIYTAEL